MNDQIVDYYTNQAGSGLAGFGGYKHQKGHGFGSFLKSIWSSIMPYFAPKLVSAGVKLGSDFLEGQNMKSSLSKRVRETGVELLDDSASRARRFIQTGKGRRKALKNRKKKPAVKKAKKVKPKRRVKRRKRSVRKKTLKSKHQFDHLF